MLRHPLILILHPKHHFDQHVCTVISYKPTYLFPSLHHPLSCKDTPPASIIMQYTIFTLMVSLSYVSAQNPVSDVPAGSLPLGAVCNAFANPSQCANGARCYAMRAGSIASCGSLNAPCSMDTQCAFNSCRDGVCSGPLSISSSSPSETITNTPTGSYTPPPSSTATIPAGSLPLGTVCNAFANPSQCANGASCYAMRAGSIASCGSLNAPCSMDTQCAFNSCRDGVCSGPLSISSSSPSETITNTPTGSYTPPPSSTATVPAGSLPLGAQCNANTVPSQCADGVSCYAMRAGSIASCGGINAPCSRDTQCVSNVCNNSICAPPLQSSVGDSTLTVQPTGGSTLIESATATTTSMTQFTGAASVADIGSGLMAVIFGAAAWIV